MYSLRPKPPYPVVAASRITVSSSQTRLSASAVSRSITAASSSVSVSVSPVESVTGFSPVMARELTSPPESS